MSETVQCPNCGYLVEAPEPERLFAYIPDIFVPDPRDPSLCLTCGFDKMNTQAHPQRGRQNFSYRELRLIVEGLGQALESAKQIGTDHEELAFIDCLYMELLTQLPLGYYDPTIQRTDTPNEPDYAEAGAEPIANGSTDGEDPAGAKGIVRRLSSRTGRRKAGR